jgi:hypothetical protein
MFNAANGIITPYVGPVPTGGGTGSAGFPDGTNARRAQLSARVIF